MQIISAACVALAALSTGVAAQSATNRASNFTYQVKWPQNIKVLAATSYSAPQVNLAQIPDLKWSLQKESEAMRTSICSQQMSWCAKAGCDGEGEVHDNWCDPKTMGTKCTCTKGTSRLAQYQWPVQTNDCRLRGQACRDMCYYGGIPTDQMATCVSKCDSTFGQACGLEGQISANYAVMSANQAPSLLIMQGGTAQSPASAVGRSASAVAVAAGLTLSLAALL